jgi:prepilin-type N-terminal cleavage/methylation domain-containing protein
MLSGAKKSSAFTLVELIFVMVILAIMAAVFAPALTRFAQGRANSNVATLMLGMAQYARAQAAAEGRTYRMNFDPSSGTFWLTAQGDDGAYTSPTNDFGQRYSISDGGRLDVQINPQANVQMNLPSTVQQNPVQLAPAVADPNVTNVNMLMQNQRTTADQYVEFQPSGRTDSALIRLTDRLGGVIELSCASATEQFRILKPGEMQ